MRVPWGTTSRLQEIRIIDYQSPAGSQGKGLTTLTTATTNLWVGYRRDTAAADVQITPLETMTAGTWVDRGFVHTAVGVYHVGLPDAAYAAGANTVRLIVKSSGGEVAGLVETHKVIELYDPVEDTVRKLFFVGTVAAGSTTTEIRSADFTQTTVDHFNGRALSFADGALEDVGAIRVQSYDPSPTPKRITLAAALPATPAAGTTFVLHP